MIKKISTIKVKLGTDGTLDLIECPVKLYKDSYNNIKLSCLVPETEQTTDNVILKVYASSYNTSGDKVWTSQTYNLPYSEDLTIDGFVYRKFVDYIPQEFCQQAGDLTLTFAYEQTNGEDETTEIITSGDLTLYIDGQGLNSNSIKISAYDQTVAKVNNLAINKVDKVPTAVSGNLASFVDGGGVKDSGIPAEFVGDNKEYVDNGDASTLQSAKVYTDDKVNAEASTRSDADTALSTRLTSAENNISTLNTSKADKSELPTKTSDLTNDSGFIDNTVNNLVNYTLSAGVGAKLQLSINTTNYIMTISLLNANDDVLSTQTIDFPLESMVVGASYANGTLTLTLQNGQTLDIDISDIIDGLVPESRTINGKPLSSNIILTNTDVGAPSVNDLNNGLASKININQGSSNAGKILTVGADGIVSPESAGTAGTAVEVNGVLQTEISFNSDPQTQLNNKVDKVQGKGLSTNDFSNAEKEKLNNTLSKIGGETGTSFVLSSNGNNFYSHTTAGTVIGTSNEALTLRGMSSNPTYIDDDNNVQNIVLQRDLLNKIYPIGSIYMSYNQISPASFLGGTWTQITDRFLLSAGSLYTAGSTGGEATHTLIISEMPSHSHTMTAGITMSNSHNHNTSNGANVIAMCPTNASNVNLTPQSNITGEGQAHNNMPPYLVVYMWRRTE